MISLEHFDYQQELEFLFYFQLFMAAIYHDHKMVSVPTFHQIMHISHDNVCVVGDSDPLVTFHLMQTIAISTMRTFTIHSTIHCHLQSAWPSPSCAGSLPQRSHTALALGPHGHIEQQAEQQSSHPEGRVQ